MSEVESVLSAEQRARGQALIIARDVLKATSFVSSSAVAAADLITVAEYVLVGGSLFVPEERDRVNEAGDGEFEVRDGSLEEFPSAYDMAVRIRDLIQDLRSKYGQGVELSPGDVERVSEVLTGHDVSSRVDGVDVGASASSESTLGDAGDSDRHPLGDDPAGGGAAGPEPVAPDETSGQAP